VAQRNTEDLRASRNEDLRVVEMSFPNRTLCTVLEEMRECFKTYNFSPMLGLIEEVQIIGNRMESGLEQKRDYYRLVDDCKELEQKLKKLQNKLKQARQKK
jgi:hypothetical protein